MSHFVQHCSSAVRIMDRTGVLVGFCTMHGWVPPMSAHDVFLALFRRSDPDPRYSLATEQVVLTWISTGLGLSATGVMLLEQVSSAWQPPCACSSAGTGSVDPIDVT